MKTKPGVALTAHDRLWRNLYNSLDELDLRSELVRIGGDIVRHPTAPEFYIQKAMIAEALTRFDAGRGTNHWHRAMTHFTEAIDLLREEVDTPQARRRLAQVLYYRSICYRHLGEKEKAAADRAEALKDETVEAAVVAEEK